jgi:N-acetyl-gamma-glutamyl-phosphate reductase
MKIAIMGAAGYSGIELLRILKRHPQAEIAAITSGTFKNKKIYEVYPEFRGSSELVFEDETPEALANRCEAVFLALPAEASLKAADEFVKYGKYVIDLSGAFRLKDKDLYKTWYGFEHNQPQLLKKAVYGIPELFREEISAARFVTNPGCYPTSVLLGLAPVLDAKIVKCDPVIVDAKSGVSGRGRRADVGSLFCELNEDMCAYKVGRHQHVPEMEQVASGLAKGKSVSVLFVPQLVPLERGILSTIYLTLEKSMTTEEARDLYAGFYENEPFIRVLEPGVWPHLRAVSRTNCCDIGLHVSGKTLVVQSAIDNLVKGAAGQAVQNFNLMTGLPEETALIC